MINKNILTLICIIYLSMSCSKLDIKREFLTAPDIVKNITPNSAIVETDIIDLGGEIDNYGHCWSKEQNPSITDLSTVFNSKENSMKIQSQLKDLEPNTRYFVRNYIQNGNNFIYGEEFFFSTYNYNTTIVKTDELLYLNIHAVNIKGEIIDMGQDVDTLLQHGFCWSKSENPTIIDSVLDIGLCTQKGIFSGNIPNLILNKKYYLKAFARHKWGTSYGDQIIIQTTSDLPKEDLLTILEISPKNNSDNISLDDTITISFNKPINTETLNDFNVYLKETSNDAPLDSKLLLLSPNTLQLIPNFILIANTSYEIVITESLEALDGSYMIDKRFSFKTQNTDINFGLKAHYLFNGTTEDNTTNGYDASIIGAFFRNDRFGNRENCLELSKRGDYIEFPNIFDLSKQEWSYSIWFNIQRTPESISLLLGTEDGSCAWGDHPLYFGKLRNLFSYSNGKFLKYESPLEEDFWYHCVIVINHGRIEFYLNGSLVAAKTGYINPDSTGSFENYFGKLYISEYRVCDNYSAMIGYVDDVRFYNRALNKFEVIDLYNFEK